MNPSVDTPQTNWRRAEAVIDALLEEGFDLGRPLDADGDSLVASRCDGDESLRDEVLDLLERMQEDDLLDAPLGEIAPELLASVEENSSDIGDALVAGDATDRQSQEGGRYIDRYRTLAILGRGGMGVVYRAERSDGTFDKEVALKVLPLGLDTPEAVRRFRRERQILARLEHPNIARLLDGGLTADGSPYLVMELVDGAPIDRYCADRDLSIRERVELFLQVCAAVRYAHRKLVVHRDLKPTNCLVTTDGTVKLLDFGIGKILENDGFGSDPGTVVQPMTPSYASPEQLANQPVSTATDVYSLGLLLYRVLTGTHAFEPTQPRRPTQPSTDRSLSPVAPSQRVCAEGGRSPARRRKELRGDLDVIVLEALRPDPEQRTGSVEDLSDDLRRWLEGRPISARPISRPRRLGMFLLRHRMATAATAAILALTVAGVVGIATQGRVAARERDRARVEAARSQRVVGFLTGILQASSADSRGSGERTARELLHEAEGRIRAELQDDPLVLAALLDVMSYSYMSFTEDEKALALAEEAVALLEGLEPEPAQQLAQSWITLARIREGLGLAHDGQELVERALRKLEREGHAESETAASAHRNLASIHLRSGRPEEALEHARRAVQIFDGLGAVGSAAIARTTVASALSRLGRLDESLELNRQALAVFVDVYGVGHPNTTSTRNNIANTLMALGRPAEAEALHRAAYDAGVQIFGEDSRRVGGPLANLARALLMQGRGGEALEAAERSIDLLEQGLEADHPALVGARMNQASALAAVGRLEEAERVYREGLRRFERTAGQESLVATRVRSLLGAVLVERGMLEDAERELTSALEVQERRVGARPTRHLAETLLFLSHLRARQGRCAASLDRLRSAWPILGAVPPGSPEHARRVAVESLCGESSGSASG